MYPGYDQLWVALITTEGCGTSSSFGTFLQLWRIWNLASSSLLWKYMKNINCKMIRIFWHGENHRFKTKNGDCMLNFRKLHVESSSKSVIVGETLSPYVRIITWSHVRSPQGVVWKGRRWVYDFADPIIIQLHIPFPVQSIIVEDHRMSLFIMEMECTTTFHPQITSEGAVFIFHDSRKLWIIWANFFHPLQITQKSS